MDRFVGKWKNDRSRDVGTTQDAAKIFNMPEETAALLSSMDTTITIQMDAAGAITNTMDVEGLEGPITFGPFKLGEPLEREDPMNKRTEVITLKLEGDKLVSTSTIKGGTHSYTSTQYTQGNELIMEISGAGSTIKKFYTKV